MLAITATQIVLFFPLILSFTSILSPNSQKQLAGICSPQNSMMLSLEVRQVGNKAKSLNSQYQALWSKYTMRHKATNYSMAFYNSSKTINNDYILCYSLPFAKHFHMKFSLIDERTGAQRIEVTCLSLLSWSEKSWELNLELDHQ